MGYQKLSSAVFNNEVIKEIEDDEDEEQRKDMRCLATKTKRNLDENNKNMFK